MGEGVDHLAVGRAEAAGAVGDPQAGEELDRGSQDPGAGLSDETLAIVPRPRIHESAANDQVGPAVQQRLGEPADLAGAMLAVAVHLHGHIIVVQGGIPISRLHGAADAEVEGEADDGGAGGDLAGGVVGRTIVDDDDIEMRQGPLEPAHDSADRRAFVERRDDRQAARRRGHRQDPIAGRHIP